MRTIIRLKFSYESKVCNSMFLFLLKLLVLFRKVENCWSRKRWNSVLFMKFLQLVSWCLLCRPDMWRQNIATILLLEYSSMYVSSLRYFKIIIIRPWLARLGEKRRSITNSNGYNFSSSFFVKTGMLIHP